MAKLQLIIFLLFYLCNFCEFSSIEHRFHPAKFLKPLNYSVEEFDVTTEDGYILKLFHVISKSNHSKGPAVYLQHGLLGSCAHFCVIGKKSLVATLMEANLDVWMGNNRGSFFSDRHNSSSVERNSFWKFTWHHIGFYDIPAFIKFILEYTKQPRLHYVGFSQGTTAFFVMMSQRPEFSDKIKSMQALAPAVFLSHVPKFSIRVLARLLNILTFTWKALGLPEKISGHILARNRFLKKLCGSSAKIKGYAIIVVCKFFVEFTEKNAAPSSIYTFFHYLQQIRSGRFANYDFGREKNLQIYKKVKPPNYNLKNITVPVKVYASLDDSLIGIKDVQKLAGVLINSDNMVIVSEKKFDHNEFCHSDKARELIYEPALKAILKHEKGTI